MKINVKYGLSFRESVSVKEETLEVKHGSFTVAEALLIIAQRHPIMSEFVDASSDEAQRRHLAIALNGRLARLSDVLHDGDIVSLLLPVSGGCSQ